MIALLQRVRQAQVNVGEREIARIDTGLLVFAAVLGDDGDAQAQRLAERIVSYRVFADPQGKMNHDVRQAGGAVLLVSQFTLAANTRKGNRPSFSSAAPPELGQRLFDRLCGAVAQHGVPVETGQFGADMQVSLVNDGPVTFWLES